MSYIKNFIKPGNLFDTLWNELSWERRDDAPRREYWVNSLNRSYTYGRGAGIRTYYPRPTHAAIENITDNLEKELGFRYEGCFLNGYATERDALGWHADDDPGIDHNFPIAVISIYGNGSETALRTIQTKPIDGDIINSFVLEDGSLFLMKAGMQSTHRHRSLTYRKLVA
jgi:alkylated DNA repair dioxygenase AlkB